MIRHAVIPSLCGALLISLAFGQQPDGGAAVAPGLVRWHADFAAACAAARTSGRPVLLFQLLGRLDDEFC